MGIFTASIRNYLYILELQCSLVNKAVRYGPEMSKMVISSPVVLLMDTVAFIIMDK